MTPPLPALPNAWLHLLPSKASSIWGPSVLSSGRKNVANAKSLLQQWTNKPRQGLHCDFACLLYSKLVNRLPESQIVEIISSAVAIKMEFVVNAFPVKLIRMNSAMMCNYIEFCANQLLLCIGCNCHFKAWKPFEWMETISLQGKTNFFEKRIGEYSKSSIGILKVLPTWKLIWDTFLNQNNLRYIRSYT